MNILILGSAVRLEEERVRLKKIEWVMNVGLTGYRWISRGAAAL